MNIRQFTFWTVISALVVLIGCTGPQGPEIVADDSGKRFEDPSSAPPAVAPPTAPSGATTDTGVVPATETSAPDTTPAPTPVDAASALPDTATTSAPDTSVYVDSSMDTAMADTFVTDTFVPDTFVADTAIADTAVASPETGTTTVGELVLHVRLPRWGTSHVTVLKGYEEPLRDGGAKWGSALGTSTGKGVDLTLSIVKGSKFVFTGFYDGDPSKGEDWTNSFVDYATGTVKVAIWGSFNGIPIARPTVKPNASGGYNLIVVAAPSPLISATDKDGDGFTVAAGDCNDDPASGQAQHPWQVEAPEDGLDFNCDGKIDPPRAIIRLSGVSLGYAPVVKDVVNWGRTYTLSWNSSIGAYESSPFEMEMLPREFFIEWGSSPTLYDSSYEGGSCTSKATVQIRRDLDGTLIPVTLKIAASGGTCHRFASL